MKFLLFPVWAFLAVTHFFTGHHVVIQRSNASTTAPNAIQKAAFSTPIQISVTASTTKKLVPKPVAIKPVATTTATHASSTDTSSFPKIIATSTPAVVSDFAAQVEQAVFDKVNIERTNNNLPALKLDTKLAVLARAHSKDMLVNDYFEHTDLSGCTSACRVTNSGYSWSAVGENIYMMSGYHLSAENTAQMIVEGWMNSPGHRANILNASFTNEGIGVYTQNSVVEATEEFALPR